MFRRLCRSPSFPLLTPNHSREPVQQGGDTLPPGTGAQAQGESVPVLTQLLGEQAHVCLSMLRQPWGWGAPEGLGQEEDEKVVSVVLPHAAGHRPWQVCPNG